jgi:hypothetical protein
VEQRVQFIKPTHGKKVNKPQDEINNFNSNMKIYKKMLANYYMEICISLRHFDGTLFEGVISPFDIDLGHWTIWKYE